MREQSTGDWGVTKETLRLRNLVDKGESRLFSEREGNNRDWAGRYRELRKVKTTSKTGR